MSPSPRPPVEQWNALLDSLAEDTLSMTDDEVLSVAQTVYVDSEARVDELRAMAIEAIAQAKRARLIWAREELDRGQAPVHRDLLALSVEAVTERLNALLRVHPDFSSELTLAFRRGESMSINDMVGMLEDLEELDRLQKDG